MKKVILSIAVMAAAITMTSVQQVNAAVEQPAINIVMDDDGFVEVQLQDLSEVVQTSINGYTQEYDVTTLKHNAEKQLTKVVLTKKDDQTTKKVYLDAEGKEVQKDKNKAEEPRRLEQQQQPPMASFSMVMQDDGYANVKFEDLNEKVQNAVRGLIDKYDVNALQYDAAKKVTKVTATNKEDKSEKIVLLNDNGEEVSQEAAQQKTETETETETQTETPWLF